MFINISIIPIGMGLNSIAGLSLAIAKTEFKQRNEGSYLGMLWYLLNPLLMFTLLFLVFGDRLGGSIPHYPLYLLLGIIIFNSFHQATTESTRQIIENDYLIKSVHFPYISLICGVVLKTLFSHILEIIVFTGFLVFFQVSAKGIVFYPIILALFSLFVLGVSSALSAAAVYLIDLGNIWMFVSRLLWFATPIFYSIENQTRLLYFNMLNPMYYFITASRDILIYQKPPHAWIICGMIVFAAVSITAGMLIFNKLKGKFAEMV